jgi:hypothetical protein
MARKPACQPGAAGRRTFDVHVSRAELAKALDGAVHHTEQQDNVTFHMRPTYVDLDACVVAVFLQDIESKQILTACALSPTAPDEVRR